MEIWSEVKPEAVMDKNINIKGMSEQIEEIEERISQIEEYL